MVPFLAAVDELVRTQPGLLDRHERLGIGVASGLGCTWWLAVGAEPVETSVSKDRPRDLRASLVISARDAQTILDTGRLPEEPELLLAGGDVDRLRRLLRRLSPAKSWLNVRADD